MMSADQIRSALAVAGDIKQVIELVAAADALVKRSGKANDVEGYRDALELKLRAERAGGAMSRTNRRLPVGKLGIATVVDRWRKLADLDDVDFEKKAAAVRTTRLPPGLRPPRPVYVPPGAVVTTMSAWQVDEHGVLCREKVTEGKAPSLKGEHPHAT